MYPLTHCHFGIFPPVTWDIFGKRCLMQEYDQLDDNNNPDLMRWLLLVTGLTIVLIGGFVLCEQIVDMRLQNFHPPGVSFRHQVQVIVGEY